MGILRENPFMQNLLYSVTLTVQTKAVFFPLQWTRTCISVDSIASKVTLVVDGKLMGETEYRRKEDKNRPEKIHLLLGYHHKSKRESTGMIADLNMFNSSLSVERMEGLTSAGEKECGVPGDLVSWDPVEWALHSQAKIVKMDREWEGPCRRESQVQVFTADFEKQHKCMHHCTMG